MAYTRVEWTKLRDAGATHQLRNRGFTKKEIAFVMTGTQKMSSDKDESFILPSAVPRFLVYLI